MGCFDDWTSSFSSPLPSRSWSRSLFVCVTHSLAAASPCSLCLAVNLPFVATDIYVTYHTYLEACMRECTDTDMHVQAHSKVVHVVHRTFRLQTPEDEQLRGLSQHSMHCSPTLVDHRGTAAQGTWKGRTRSGTPCRHASVSSQLQRRIAPPLLG